VTKAGVNCSPGKIACCACSVVKYVVAKAEVQIAAIGTHAHSLCFMLA
jgi:hypothetical protein